MTARNRHVAPETRGMNQTYQRRKGPTEIIETGMVMARSTMFRHGAASPKTLAVILRFSAEAAKAARTPRHLQE